MFGFDERYAMFDITPVENQFILEYLPDAKGEYIKVYLYGLMYCYHPEKDMSLTRMSQELNMSEDDLAAAFRYWERRRLVRRISDKPPKWQFVNIKQINLLSDDSIDPEYQNFSNAVYEAFDKVRHLHGSEINMCFEWHEDLKLPTEAIIMLLNHMVQIHGKNFTFANANKIAVQMANEKIQTIDEAEDFFVRNSEVYKNTKDILKRLGKRYIPSDQQVALYIKWTKEWGFSHETIVAATSKTAKDPTFPYLDGVLYNLKQDYNDGLNVSPTTIENEKKRNKDIRQVFRELGGGDITPHNIELYENMIKEYPLEIIKIAARETGRSGRKFDDMNALIQAWKEKGLNTQEDVEKYVRDFHEKLSFIHEIRALWGAYDNRAGVIDRNMLAKWENEMGFGRDMILTAAHYAAEANQPMSYLDKILQYYKKNGIFTPEQAKKDYADRKINKQKDEKKVIAQEYEQRDYKNVQEQLIEAQEKRILDRLRAEGGETNA